MRFASLYSGCGGLDQGFLDAGLSGLCAIDFDKSALSNLAANLGTQTVCMDLSEFGEQHRALLEGVDIIAAGPPCQGFSTAGRNDPDDNRNDHVWNVARIATLIRPKVVLIENVRGLLNPKNLKHFDKTVSVLRENGYSVSWSTYNLTDYGIAQRRVRVLIFAVLSETNVQLQIPCQERKSLEGVLEDVNKISDFEPKLLGEFSDEKLIARKISPGQKLSNVRSGLSAVHTWEIPEVFGAVTRHEVNLLETIVKLRRQKRKRDFGDADPVAMDEIRKYFKSSAQALVDSLIDKNYLRRVDSHIDLTNTFNGKFRRLKWDDVSPTVDTRFGQPRYFLHPSEDRGFTVREAARIQGFSDGFAFSGSEAAKYRMIGNAVPPGFAKLVAENIVTGWDSL
uniref:DNA cytosine methyltransferase n=1 Tax=Pararhizobium sp. IMCC3301 TaxID=3067904 RepID=UPI002741F268|nr:DNA cytosine methyltransferase [Pararhizobium sp. IMCC3301]